MSEIAFALLLILALVALAAQHNWWARQIADRDTDWHTQRDNETRLRDEIAKQRKTIEFWKDGVLALNRSLDLHKKQLILIADNAAALNNELVVERAYSAACDAQLRAIRDQVAGKLHCTVARTPIGERGQWREVIGSREVDRDAFDRIIGADEFRASCGWRS